MTEIDLLYTTVWGVWQLTGHVCTLCRCHYCLLTILRQNSTSGKHTRLQWDPSKRTVKDAFFNRYQVLSLKWGHPAHQDRFKAQGVHVCGVLCPSPCGYLGRFRLHPTAHTHSQPHSKSPRAWGLIL